MIENGLLAALKNLLSAARQRRVKVVIMGGMATSVYSSPRATYDVDGIADIKEEQIAGFLESLRKKGFMHEKKRPVQSIGGLPFITLYYSRCKVYVDLFLARSEFQKQAIKRSRVIKMDNIQLNVISPEDLILVKLLTGRSKDTEDTRRILLENKEILDFVYLGKWAKRLGINIFLQDELKSLGITPPKAKRRKK